MTCLPFIFLSKLPKPLSPTAFYGNAIAADVFYGNRPQTPVGIRATEVVNAETSAHRAVYRLGGMEAIP